MCVSWVCVVYLCAHVYRWVLAMLSVTQTGSPLSPWLPLASQMLDPRAVRGPGGGSGGSIIHLHLLPVYNGRTVWSMACVPVDPSSHKAAPHTHTTNQLSQRPGNTRRSSGNTSQSHPDTWIHYTGLTRCMVYSSSCPNTLHAQCRIAWMLRNLTHNCIYRLWKDSLRWAWSKTPSTPDRPKRPHSTMAVKDFFSFSIFPAKWNTTFRNCAGASARWSDESPGRPNPGFTSCLWFSLWNSHKMSSTGFSLVTGKIVILVTYCEKLTTSRGFFFVHLHQFFTFNLVTTVGDNSYRCTWTLSVKFHHYFTNCPDSYFAFLALEKLREAFTLCWMANRIPVWLNFLINYPGLTRCTPECLSAELLGY